MPTLISRELKLNVSQVAEFLSPAYIGGDTSPLYTKDPYSCIQGRLSATNGGKQLTEHVLISTGQNPVF